MEPQAVRHLGNHRRRVTQAGPRHRPYRRQLLPADATQICHALPLERYYLRAQVGEEWLPIDPDSQAVVAKALRHSSKRTSQRAFHKITRTTADGDLEIIEAPPTLQLTNLTETVSVTELVK